jgi:hypothetical protein
MYGNDAKPELVVKRLLLYLKSFIISISAIKSSKHYDVYHEMKKIIIQGGFAVIKLKKKVVLTFKAVDAEDKVTLSSRSAFCFSWLWDLVTHFLKKQVCKQCSRKRANIGDTTLRVNFGYYITVNLVVLKVFGSGP